MKRSGSMWIRDEDEFMPAFFEPSGDRFEIEHLEQALQHVGARRVALDIGAHYGSWARHLARSFERIVAFEPVPDTFACLQRNVEHLPNVEARNAAVGGRSGFVGVGVGKMYSHPGMETVIGEGTSRMVTVDELGLDRVDFIKIDVEGYELFVLQGAERTLLRNRPVVLFEENVRGPLEHGIENGECGKYLEALGARFVRAENKDLIYAWPEPGTRAAFDAQFPGSRTQPVDAELVLPIVASVGRDLAAGSPERNVVGREYPTQPRHPFRVVSFYTAGNGYDVLAARLRDSLTRLGLPFTIEEVEDRATWEGVCALKSQFVREQWRGSDVPVVWVDADAVVEQAPDLFRSIDADFAAHRWSWEPGKHDHGFELGSGTLYFGRSDLAGALLDRWALRCAADPDTWDQTHLQSAWCDIGALHPLRTVWLPRAYLQIDGAPEPAPAVVRHFQASRTEKARRDRPAQVQFALSPQGIADRRHNRLWRTVEQAFWIAEGTEHIIPKVGNDFPEGFDVGEVLHRFLGTEATILEFGCGIGRLAGLFAAERYLGVDINPSSVALARQRNPDHRIRVWDSGQVVPPTEALMLYTVLLHVSDAALRPLVEALCVGRDCVLIAELMDRRWRREGDPPVFNRDPEDYIVLMEQCGFRIEHFEKHSYARYDQHPWNVGRDTRITFLKFLRRR